MSNSDHRHAPITPHGRAEAVRAATELEQHGELIAAAWCFLRAGEISHHLGAYEDRSFFVHRALGLFQSQDFKEGQAHCLLNVAINGHPKNCLHYLAKARALFEQIEDWEQAGRVCEVGLTLAQEFLTDEQRIELVSMAQEFHSRS